MGGVWGVFAALGIIVAQRLLSQAVAAASAVFMSSTAIASALGGLTGSLGVSVLACRMCSSPRLSTDSSLPAGSPS